MCGINGFNFKGEELIGRMNAAVEHRGPDQEGLFFDENFSLGHRRLSIIDLSERGRQPIFNEDKTLAIVFNGEIYNFKDLRAGLEKRGHKFYSDTDTEALLHLFEEKGEKCLDALDGIFAFAIYNLKDNSLFLARDHLGVKPLYYFWNPSPPAGGSGQARLIFSSEIKAILEHPVERQIEPRALNSYFHLFYPLAPLTIFKNIYKLEPGHFLKYKSGAVEVNRYWQPASPDASLCGPELKEKISDKSAILENLRQLTESAVKKQMISDRPLGVFLSGGIDSTIVASIARNHCAGKLKTFCVGFESAEEQEKFNVDFNLARRVAKDFGTDHHELVISAKDILPVLEKVAWHLDEPLSNHTQSITYLLAQYTKNEAAVVLGGDGGDEIFAGYPRYRLNLMLDWYQKIPGYLRKNFLNKAVASFKNIGDQADKLETPPGLERYLLFMSQKNDKLARVIKPECLANNWYNERLAENFSDLSALDSTDALMLTDLKNWLAEESLMRTDKTTMAWGLEERVPLLDRSLVEFGFKIPSHYKIKISGGKRIFKEALKNHLPDYVAKAPKRGWFSPMAKWLRGDLKDFAYDVLSENYTPGTQEFFDFPVIRKILDDHISKKEYNLALIWSLISFQLWYKNFMASKK